MVTVGLDLHKRYITGCALDEEGTVLSEHRSLEPSLDALGRWLGGLPPPVLVAMEATLYWHWLEQQLTERGFSVQVAHPSQVKLIWQARTKTDPIDARKLAELARAKLLPAIWIPDPTTCALRQLLRGRVFLVRQRTVMRNRIHAYLTAENRRCPELDLYSKVGQDWLATVDLPPRRARPGHVGASESRPVDHADSDAGSPYQDHGAPRRDRASTADHPGDRPVRRALAPSGDRTDRALHVAQELAACAGLVPSTHSSGDKTRHGRVGRGNPWLKWLLIEALQTLKLAPGPVGDHYRKLLRAKGKPKATVAAARKFCTYLYWMLKEEWSYTEWLRQHDRSEVRPMQPLGSAA